MRIVSAIILSLISVLIVASCGAYDLAKDSFIVTTENPNVCYDFNSSNLLYLPGSLPRIDMGSYELYCVTADEVNTIVTCCEPCLVGSEPYVIY